ncbi:aspartyl protease family protein [Terriglobus albidus]|uniref:aspartyl protease family protein n=1 Tax=Terriglobus albidus TaxID=1592106 RepID=UPI0021E0286E|nr:aspartyl protease family protein [Terriglobus albidus]
MKRGRVIYLLILLDIASSVMRAQVSSLTRDEPLDELVRQRQWSELRAAASRDSNAGFYRAVAAAVYNVPEAESLFKQVIQDAPASEHAYEAYNWLANLYQKSGRYHSLAVIRQAQWRSFPDRKEIASQKQEDAPFMGLPDQENGPRATSRLHHDGHSLPAPATINGKHVEFFFDNGADLSCISEDEARRLGLAFSKSAGVLGTMTQSVGFRMATAKQVTIGKMRFRNVSFAVFPDDQPPMSLVPLGHRGIIGLPLMVAIGTFRWDANGTLVIGEEPQEFVPERSNLIFDAGDHIVLQAKFQGEPIWMSLDSGATTTDVYAPFARRFSDYLQQHGNAGQNQIIGLGGAESHDSIDVPELSLQIDGKDLTLRPAHIMTKHQDHRDWIFANVGKDLYMQTSAFVLDLHAMRLMLK